MICLPDVNVWVALWVDRHAHHPVAREWFTGLAARSAAFCRMTQLGFLRLLTNPTVMEDDVLDQRAAWKLHDSIRRDERVSFLPEPPGVEPVWRSYSASSGKSHRQWADGYLLAVASVAGLTLVTLDKGVAKSGGNSVLLLR
jgi:toxin-antitoxin system PIN domain toxin